MTLKGGKSILLTVMYIYKNWSKYNLKPNHGENDGTSGVSVE